MVKKLCTTFRYLHTRMSDTERSGRPNEVSTLETIQNINDIVLVNNQRLKMREIVEAIDNHMSQSFRCW